MNGARQIVVVPSYRPSFPAVALAGDRIVYVIRYFDSNVWRIDARHPGAPQAIAQSSEAESSPAVSPDDKLLVFRSSRTGADEIWISTVDGDNLRRLTGVNGPITVARVVAGRCAGGVRFPAARSGADIRDYLGRWGNPAYHGSLLQLLRAGLVA